MKALKVDRMVSSDDIKRDIAVIFDDTVLDIVRGNQIPSHVSTEVIEAKGMTLVPGFIDIHTHGLMGADTMYGAGAVLAMAKNAVKFGVTSLAPTTISSSPQELKSALEGVRDAMDESRRHTTHGANILGAHVEGPFISKRYKGAHLEEFILPPDKLVLSDYTDVVKIVTIAPELSGAEDFIGWALDNGIRISIGHTGADFDQCINAISRGASSFTHTFNAMSQLHHRNPGAVGAAMSGGVFTELICDNIHVHPAAMRILYAANRANLILITDSISAAGLGDGLHKLGFQEAAVKNGRAVLPSGTLAGSILTLDRAVKNFKLNTGASINELVKYSSTNAANMLGLKKGSIEFGYDADFILLDDNINVCGAFVSGKQIF